MNEQKDTGAPSKDDIGDTDEAKLGSDGLDAFFRNLHIHPESIASYKDKLAALGLDDVAALRNVASMSYLQEQVGIIPEDISKIMISLYETDAPDVLEYAPYAPHSERSIPPECVSTSLLSKDNVVIMSELGHGSSGRVFKVLFSHNAADV